MLSSIIYGDQSDWLTWFNSCFIFIAHIGLVCGIVCVCTAITLKTTVWVFNVFGLFDGAPGIGHAFHVAFGVIVDLVYPPRDFTLRSRFRKRMFTSDVPELPAGHPHPNAARHRDTACRNIDDFITDAGHTVYSVSIAARENSVHTRGTRGLYSARDIGPRSRLQPIRPTDVIKMVDVDYYLDFGFYMSLMRPMVLYTFTPKEVAGPLPDGAFCTNQDNTITTFITGGMSYSHQLWNHNSDFVCYRGFFHDYYHSVETRVIGESCWSYVLYIPVSRVPRFLSWFMTPVPFIGRRSFRDGNFAINTYIQEHTSIVSLSHFGATQAVELPQIYLQSLIDRYTAVPSGFNLGSIDVVMRALGHDETIRTWATPILYHYVLQRPLLKKPSPPIRDAINYFPVVDGTELDQTGAIGRSIHPPLVAGGCTPALNLASEVVAVNERVTKLQEVSQTGCIDPYPQYTSDFLDYFCKPLIPVSLEEVEAKQNRPSQKQAAIRNLAGFGLGSSNPSSFVKSEAYAVISPPRVITTVSADHRLRLSRFSHAINAHLKSFPWYAFGMTPLDLANRMVDVCKNFKEVFGTDFSKFDGRHSQLLYILECEVMRRCFKDHPEAVTLMAQEVNKKAKTKRNHRYDTGYSRLSGSPVTSGFNSLNNAFLCYVALRLDGHIHSEAVSRLGIYGGDDGVTPPLRDSGNLARVASSYGANLTVERFDSWVPFLGRIYLCPFVRNESIYDLRRFVAKAHITVASKDVPLGLAASRKSAGFRVTDSQTPLVAEWCDYVDHKYGVSKPDDLLHDNDVNWFARGVVKFKQPPFPQATINDPLVQQVALELVGPELPTLITNLKAGIFPFRLEGAPAPKINAVLGGDLHIQLAPNRPDTSVPNTSFCPTTITGPPLQVIPSVSETETPKLQPPDNIGKTVRRPRFVHPSHRVHFAPLDTFLEAHTKGDRSPFNP